MAVSYASGLPAGRSQTLPSFREVGEISPFRNRCVELLTSLFQLLPPHLHDEIESTSYYAPSRQYQERPLSSTPDSLSEPRSFPGYGRFESPSKPAAGDGLRDFSLRPSRADENLSRPYREHGPLHASHAGNAIPPPATSRPTSQFASQGPSPILPPIRDLQSLPERSLSRPGNLLDDATMARPNTFPQEFGGGGGHEVNVLGSRNIPGTERDRPAAQPYLGGGGMAPLYKQSPYDSPRYVHYPAENSPQLMHNAQHPNFGILGDPIDPRSKRRRGNLPKPVTDILRQWFHEHLDHPYPSEEDKQIFMSRTGLSISQVCY